LLKTIGAGALVNGLVGCSSLSTGDEGEKIASKATADGTTSGTETDAPPSGGKRVAFGNCTSVLPGESDPQRLTEDISENTTLGDDCSQYVVSGTIDVTGTTLTVTAGTELVFEQNAGLKIASDATLVAKGTCKRPILFTGEQETRGYWRGIYFDNTNRIENELHYCVVGYGGGGNEFWNAKEHANVAVTNGSQLSIRHSTIRNSAGYGYEVTQDSTLTASANSIVDNVLGASVVT
jgi:hypothetical protein